MHLWNLCDYDSDSDDEFTNEQRVELLRNIIVEHERLIKSYMKDHDLLEAHKKKLIRLKLERLIFLRKLDLLNMSINLSLRRIMILHKRSRTISHFHL